MVTFGLIERSFSKGTKSFLNSDPLSKTTFLGLGYLASHVCSNRRLILVEDLSMMTSSVDFPLL